MEEREKSCLPYGDKAIILNEERKKFGLAPIPGGDVAIIRVPDSSGEEMVDLKKAYRPDEPGMRTPLFRETEIARAEAIAAGYKTSLSSKNAGICDLPEMVKALAELVSARGLKITRHT